jgi:hypothetical protein
VSHVAVVLDASALDAYAAGVVAVGELMAEVADEGRLVGVPATCLVQARASAADRFALDQFALLATVDAVAVLPLDVEGVREVGEFTRSAAGDIGLGHAVQTALAHEAYYVTAQPKRAAAVLPAGWGVLDVGA